MTKQVFYVCSNCTWEGETPKDRPIEAEDYSDVAVAYEPACPVCYEFVELKKKPVRKPAKKKVAKNGKK